ncbi:MAG: 16S rRNA (cytosine(967)-C(5))-methyltransferase [Acidobacteria bacterium RIFCSPLOWO2_02_FULL_68_18]|nr:MAG: 16S rRNA (cytosine(967)-C(5))-methyltransferase [Acidobacteria bacterium RIFCSPLOWO2_02_FULL_68_18]OFW50254.1 MAG: 16S rRNA (cytosine(967)-C(5))-methyltransferase [Acidobacteria bacterium RIFCSPLOWO2_12_FULL_68_19]
MLRGPARRRFRGQRVTSPARIAAYRALRAIAAGRADLPSSLAHSRQELTDERDRALAADIVTGTLRWQRNLDFVVQHLAGRPLSRIDDDVQHILRLSAYQVLHLDRVPVSAVVNDAVTLTRRARKTSAAALVNAVLRTLVRQRHRLPLPSRPASAEESAALAYLGVTHSHPEWLVARWLRRYGFDATERWVRFNNDAPRVTLRANTVRTTRDEAAAALARRGVETAPTPRAPDGLVVTAGNPLGAPPDGTFLVQDEASQLVSLAVGAHRGERILDLCASPGGKSVAMAGDTGDTGLLVACDVRPRRIELLRQTVRTSGARSVHVVHVAASGGLPFAPAFDRVLVDAPCSGLGTIRRDPDIRWRRSERDLAVFARDQLALLERAAEVVGPGGRLVYATCSSEPEEDEAVVDAFLARRVDFEPLDLRDDGASPLVPLLDERGRLRTLPFAHGLEAFFAAALVRRGTIRS